MKKTDQNAQIYYMDIFSFPHWEPTSATPTGRLKHPRMPMEKRAAIFASFDALSGYKDATVETARTTDKRIELSETQKENLNQRLTFLIDRAERETANGMMPGNIISADVHKSTFPAANTPIEIPSIPPTTSPLQVSITYFSPDAKKDGGEYRTLTGIIKKIDLYERTILLDSGQAIHLDDIADITGELFSEMNVVDFTECPNR